MAKPRKQMTCVRCGYTWTPVVRRGRPKQCARCRSRDWWKPRQRPMRKNSVRREG